MTISPAVSGPDGKITPTHKLRKKVLFVDIFGLAISERRIADVQKSRNLIAAETKVDFSDAAGFRKPIKFNCISCSRPVELPLRGPLQSNLPAPRGVRTKRSKGPYLSYEMDQVRTLHFFAT